MNGQTEIARVYTFRVPCGFAGLKFTPRRNSSEIFGVDYLPRIDDFDADLELFFPRSLEIDLKEVCERTIWNRCSRPATAVCLHRRL